jgi:hypothetical protein
MPERGIMHIYELVSRDRTHPVRVYLLHPEYWTEDEFYNLLLEGFQRSSASDWHLQILELAEYLVTAHGFVEAGGLQEISFPGELPKNEVKRRIEAFLGKDRSD